MCFASRFFLVISIFTSYTTLAREGCEALREFNRVCSSLGQPVISSDYAFPYAVSSGDSDSVASSAGVAISLGDVHVCESWHHWMIDSHIDETVASCRFIIGPQLAQRGERNIFRDLAVACRRDGGVRAIFTTQDELLRSPSGLPSRDYECVRQGYHRVENPTPFLELVRAIFSSEPRYVRERRRTYPHI